MVHPQTFSAHLMILTCDFPVISELGYSPNPILFYSSDILCSPLVFRFHKVQVGSIICSNDIQIHSYGYP